MAQERQRLLDVENEAVENGGSDCEGVEDLPSALMTPSDPPPTFTTPPTTFTHSLPPHAPEPPPVQFSDPPPKYAPPGEAPPYNEREYLAASGVGVPVQIQVEGGQMVQATLVQEPSGKHVVYIDGGGAGQSAPDHTLSQGRPPMPKDYLGLSLFGLVFCCFPLGIVALLRSLEVSRRYNRGDYLGAQQAAKQAHSWGSSAVVFGVCTILTFVILRFYFTPHHHYQYYS